MPVVALVLATQALPAGAAGAGYRFEQTQARGAEPVGWNPCRAIPVRVNLAHAPRHSLRQVKQALADVRAASGIDIYYAGRSHRRPGFLHSYGVQISWTTPGHEHALRGRVVGLGASKWLERPGTARHYIRGAVMLDGPALRHLGQGRRLAVLEHELGHVMGLAHVHDRNEIMYPTIGRVHSYAAGDRAGLAALGALPCS